MRSRLLFSLQNILWCGPKVGTCTTCPTWPSTGTKSGERWAEKGVSLCLDAQKGPRKKRNSKEIFRTVALFFLLSFYGLYFTHQLHITLNNYLQVLTCFLVTFCGQLSCTASTVVFLTCGHYLPLQGFELGTSPVPSWYATNWAILAWICLNNIQFVSSLMLNTSIYFCLQFTLAILRLIVFVALCSCCNLILTDCCLAMTWKAWQA